MPRLIWYMAHPYGGSPENLARARRWLAYLQAELTDCAVIAPWIEQCEQRPDDDASPTLREAGLQWDEAIVRELCDGVILVGGRVTPGMRREAEAARNVWDRTALGEEPPR